jgi:Protein of unknown function (DUF998)
VVSGVLYVIGAVGLRSALQSGRGRKVSPLLARRAVDPPPSSSLAEEKHLRSILLRGSVRDSRRGQRWGPLLVGLTGVGLIIAGVFTADPGAGFPPGAPAGAPIMSWHGMLHEIGFMLSFAGAIATCVVFARRYAALGRRRWMVAALVAAAAAVVVAGWPDLNTLSIRLVIATAILFGFLTAVFAQVLKQGPTCQSFSTDDDAEIVASHSVSPS